MALERRAQLALGTRYQVVGLGSSPIILRRWRCKNDGDQISSEDEYGSHISRHPSHHIVTESFYKS